VIGILNIPQSIHKKCFLNLCMNINIWMSLSSFKGGNKMWLSKFLYIYFILAFFLASTLLQMGFNEHKSFAAASKSVVISEIAWMGTTFSASDEWIELYNNTSSSISINGWVIEAQDGAPRILLSGSIPANGYFLLERTDDSTIQSITADQVYSESNFENAGEILFLKDNFNNIIDQVDSWYAGNNTSKATMERIDTIADGTLSASWANSTRTYEGGYGTPQSSSSMSKTRALKAAPIQLSEQTLNGNVIALNLQGETFSDNITSSVQLNNPPPGTTIGSIEKINDYSAHVTLNYNGTDFDSDYTNFSFTVLDSGMIGTGNLTSNNINVKAIQEIEGLYNYTATGNSYPTKIELAGYNTKDRQLYINSTLYTKKSVVGKTATFHYFIKVYDGNSNTIGNLGDISTPLSINASPSSSEVDLNNVVISINQDFPSAFKIVVIVKSVNIY
jgi:hypothetical protein